ncbi:MAG TPA: hypothetical protein VK543_12770 [Puia sp.]|nr:hypothetical protein [Puia sp.]
MKRNLSRLVLILEIAAITIFHVVKQNKTEITRQTEIIANTITLKPTFFRIISPYLLSQMK